jgi:isopenicillin N synthase-like dioxygenase
MIPILDLGEFLAGEPRAREQLAAQLRDALENVGFYILTNHGIAATQIEATLAAARHFHALPLATRLALKANEHNVGYVGLNSTRSRASRVDGEAARKPNLVEAYFIKRDLAPDHPDVLANKLYRPANPWPDPAVLPGFRETTVAYCHAMEALGRRMLPLYAMALGLAPDFFDVPFAEPQYTLRLSHYPPAEDGEPDQFGLSAHTDGSFLTMLAQADLPGLQIKLPDGGWQDVDAPRGSIVVNSGDLLRRWTNHRFLSTPHRAINANPGRHRYAIPFFFDASVDYPMACLPTCCSAGNPARYEPITYTEYIRWFTSQNYDHVRAGIGVETRNPGVPQTQHDRSAGA